LKLRSKTVNKRSRKVKRKIKRIKNGLRMKHIFEMVDKTRIEKKMRRIKLELEKYL